ncbi:uncharacterized protein VP01_715g9 [Puccinia sorghi]|uniref:DDE Tnp4 domain-containing protein n=1 Tax=Puccinia sorghi TaxID=27349 RepID=A0A0L6UDE8_9BASI|nr:uncharacterized protein VP01_715g9 [Puccinia sorghi]
MLKNFTYIMAGWEGCEHDTRGLLHAHNFKIPEGIFYLADTGYGLAKGVLVQYCVVFYHLRKQGLAA